jgi:uncharacterized membrane protein YedE/YeeE
MDAEMAVIVLSLVLAGVLGFSAHRASICTVRAVEEALSTRRAYLLASFAKTVVWVLAVTALVFLLVPQARQAVPGWGLSVWALGGGFLFGIGAAINGGCAFSTLTRLAAGRLGMVMSLAGLGAGIAAYVAVVPALALPAPVPVADPYGALGAWGPVLGAAAVLWAGWEAARLWQTRPHGVAWPALVGAARYRLSTAAALMGLGNGGLYVLNGRWSYTSTAVAWVDGLLGPGSGPPAVLWALFAAVVAGMGLSAWQGRRFRLHWRPRAAWIGYLVGGFLMGVGAAMTPGGNDVVLLHGIPGLSPHALPAFAAMIAGVAAGLTAMRLAGRMPATVDCRGDLCREE